MPFVPCAIVAVGRSPIGTITLSEHLYHQAWSGDSIEILTNREQSKPIHPNKGVAYDGRGHGPALALNGRSLLPLIADPAAAWRDALTLEGLGGRQQPHQDRDRGDLVRLLIIGHLAQH